MFGKSFDCDFLKFVFIDVGGLIEECEECFGEMVKWIVELVCS